MRRHERIGRREEISGILRTGARWACADFVVYIAANGGDDHRIAILVSRRHGNAVRRNRIKRILRNMVWQSRRPQKNRGLNLVFKPHTEFNGARARSCYRQWEESRQ